jgi:hypothetical protein
MATGVAMLMLAVTAMAFTACGSSNNGGGAGGAPGLGGSPGNAGHDGGTGTGGHITGTGGRNGMGGAGGMVCSTPQYTHTWAFGAIFEGWSVSPTYSTPSLAPATDGGSGTVVDIDQAEGSPAPSLKLSVPFSAPNQLLLLTNVFTTGQNLSGTKVTAQIKVDSGLITGPSETATAYLVLKSTAAYNYLAEMAVVLDPSAGFITLTIDGDVPTVDAAGIGYNPCDVRELDIEIHTGATGNYVPAVIHIDTIKIESKSGVVPDGGDNADTGTATDTGTVIDAPTTPDTGTDTSTVTDSGNDSGG